MAAEGDEREKQGVPDETKASSPVIDRMFREGYRFDFFQAANLLERLYQDAVHPGEEVPPGQEVVRFQASSKRSFPSAAISRIEPIERGGASFIRMVLTFMGLYGVDSPLPSYFSEIIAQLPDEDEGDEYQDQDEGVKALRHFLDIFGHRIYSLLYRSWKKYRYYLQFRAGAKDTFSQYMLSLLGLGTPALQDLVGVEVSRLIAYIGIIGQQVRCADGLRGLLSGYFGGIDVQIIEFMPRWVAVPEQYRVRLVSRHSRGARAPLSATVSNMACLGENVTIGGRIRDHNGKFRIVLGPLKFESFRGFLPEESNKPYKELRRLVQLYVPGLLTFDVEMLMRKEEVPPLRLTGKGSKEAEERGRKGEREKGSISSPSLPRSPAPLLGWTSWLGRPREDVVSIVMQDQKLETVAQASLPVESNRAEQRRF